MIPRYSPAEFQALWSQKHKYEVWFDVEIAACRAMEGAGLVPAGTADEVSPFRAQLDPDAIDEIEKVTRHDVIAFLTHVEEIAGEPARWLHRGMTSSDVLDSALALQLVEATDKLLVRLDAVLEALRGRIEEHRRTPAIGRSHAIHAEPVTFGLILAGHYAELARGRKRLLVAREEIAVGKIAG
ncbi:MAG: adenylosuccinate lyase, partial [Deltaproteobacteria bacterium]